MKKIPYKLLLMTIFLLGISLVASGQSVSLTSGGNPVVQGFLPGTPASTQPPAGQTLTGANLQFGNVSAISSFGRFVIIKMPIRISATKPYELRMQSGIINGGGISLSDVGFGVENIRRQPSSGFKWTQNATAVTINGTYGLDPAAANFINGAPRYKATLNELAANSLILTGEPTVGSGSLGEDANSILIDLKFVVSPQFYEVTNGFNVSLNLTVTARN